MRIPEKSDERVCTLDSNAIAMVGITAWTGLFFKLSPHCEHENSACLGLVVVVAALNILFFGHCVYLFFLEVLEDKVKRLLEVLEDKVKKLLAKCCCKKKKSVAADTAISKFEAGTAFVNPMTGDQAFSNPMYRTKRTSSLFSRMASRSDGIEMMSVASTLKGEQTALEKTLLDEVKRLKAENELRVGEVKHLKGDYREQAAQNKERETKLKAESKELKAEIDSLKQTLRRRNVSVSV